jgi:hypothetical protein
MPSTLNELREAVNTLSPGSTPEAVQEFLNIGVRFLTDVLAMRGQTVEEWRAFRKQIVDSELAIVEEELAKLENPDPLPV